MRKQTIPSPLRKLTDEELAEVHSWFKRATYDDMLDRLRERFGVHMSKTQLCRYFQRFAEAQLLNSQAQLLNAALSTPLTPADMVAIKNADPVSDTVSQEELKKQCLRASLRPNLKASELKHLFDVFTYNDRRELKERNQAIQAKQLAIREDFQEYRREIRSFKQATD